MTQDENESSPNPAHLALLKAMEATREGMSEEERNYRDEVIEAFKEKVMKLPAKPHPDDDNH